MPSVNTVNGGVDTSKLGFTLMHEHVFARSPGVFENWPPAVGPAAGDRAGDEAVD